MELSWSTFVLEIVNFLVLVWLLKRFLYRPVLEVIARRREGIERQLADARKLREEAGEQKERYAGRLAQWEEERRVALQGLDRELEAERARRLEALNTQLDAERQKREVLERRHLAESGRRLEEEALENAARFAAALLGDASCPELETRLVERAIAGLGALDGERLEDLRRGAGEGAVVVASAYPLEAGVRRALSDALARLGLGECRFEEQPELLAGLCITAGDWRLGLNLRDELQGFAAMGAAP